TFNVNHQDDEILIKIEIIEYTNSAKDQIRSRLPYQIIGYLNDENKTGQCLKIPSITFLNVESDLIYTLFNESIQIDLISQSQCDIEMNECSMVSAFHWKVKSIVETTIEDQIQIQFEWTPRLVEQCGFHTHCIRCFDQLDNFNEKCLQIFVNGFDCQRRTNSNQSCSWSPFSTWNRVNETIYRRNRTCRETFHSEKTCSFCFGSSVQYQSSLTFLKDFDLFEQSLLTPTRAQSTRKILFIATIFWIIAFLIAFAFSILYAIRNEMKIYKRKLK
ncbi:unnamed protein product, partial [Adineta ricciae]